MLITFNLNSAKKQRDHSTSDIPRQHEQIHGINISENLLTMMNTYSPPKSEI